MDGYSRSIRYLFNSQTGSFTELRQLFTIFCWRYGFSWNVLSKGGKRRLFFFFCYCLWTYLVLWNFSGLLSLIYLHKLWNLWCCNFAFLECDYEELCFFFFVCKCYKFSVAEFSRFISLDLVREFKVVFINLIFKIFVINVGGIWKKNKMNNLKRKVTSYIMYIIFILLCWCKFYWHWFKFYFKFLWVL